MKIKHLLRTTFLATTLVLCWSLGWGQIVISQIYGGGGNSGAPYNRDFIEIFNRGTSSQNLSGWSIQYASATGTSWLKTDIGSLTIQPGQYLLIGGASGATGSALPTVDVNGTLNLSGTAGKLALVNSTTLLTVSCPTGGGIIDFVGFGTTANCYEGLGTTPAPSNTTSVIRSNNGCTDTNNNNSDFSAVSPNPRNTASTFNLCSSPTITVTPTSFTGFLYAVGHGPSEVKSFTVSGANLTNNISIALPTNYQLSTSNSPFTAATEAIPLTQSGGTVSETTIYVRLMAGLDAGTYNSETITISSTGADNKTVTCSGSVVNPATTTIPYDETFDTTLGDCYVYTVAGSKPWGWLTARSVANGYSGSNPEEHWLVLPGFNADIYDDLAMTFKNYAKYGTNDANNYLKLFYSTDYPGVGNPTASTWSELSFNQPTGTISTESEIETLSGNIDLSSITGTSVFIAFKYYSTNSPTAWGVDDISIFEATSPMLNVNPTSLTSFTYDFGSGPSSVQSFTVSGANLTNNISIALPTNYELSTSNSPFTAATEAIPLTQSGGTVSETTIWVRLKAGLSVNTFNESIDITSTDATTVSVSFSGNVNPVPDPEPENHVTNFTATANSISQITVSWTDAIAGSQAPSGYLVKAAISSSTPSAPVDGTAISDGTLVKNILHGSGGSAVFTDLTPDTEYNFLIWPYTNSGTNIDYKTDGTIPEASATTLANYTNPTAQNFPYLFDFSSLAHASTTYPNGWQGWTISATPGATFNTATPTADRSLTASSTATTNTGNVHNYNGKIGFLNGGSLDLGLVLAINTTGKENINVFYDIMTIRNPYDGSSNTRINEVTLQYRIGTSGSFTNLTGIEYQNNTTLQTGIVTTPQNEQTKTIILPSACDNQSVVQLRWASRQVSGVGSRPSFAVDNVKIAETKTWNSTGAANWSVAENWTPEGVPSENSFIVVNSGTLVVNSIVSAVGVTVNAGAAVTIGSGVTLTADKVTLKTDATRKAASLINNGTLTATTVEYQRYVPDYAFEGISSPINGQTASVFGGGIVTTGSGKRLFRYNTPTSAWVPMVDADNLNAMQGYAYYINTTGVSNTVTFSGSLYSSPQSIALTTGFNLVGNPFPSSIDWKISSGWTRDENTKASSLVNTSIWINYADEASGRQFASFNYLAPEISTLWDEKVGTALGVIPPTQAFWVYAIDSYELGVNDNARVHSNSKVNKKASSNSQYLKLKIDREGYIDEMVIYFHKDALLGIDNYDTRKYLGGGAYPQLYSPVENAIMSINSLPISLLENDLAVSLTIQSAVKSKATLSLKELKGFEASAVIILKDKLNGAEYILNETDTYTFDIETTQPITNRFELLISKANTTSTGNLFAPIVNIYSTGKFLNIEKYEIGSRLTIYNTVGQQMMSKTLSTGDTFRLESRLPSGIYIVVVNSNKNSTVKRVFFE